MATADDEVEVSKEDETVADLSLFEILEIAEEWLSAFR
jgi:hypothetical protein